MDPSASQDRARVAVAIVNYRTAKLTIEAVESALAACDPLRDRVVVVDNASGDGSIEELREEATARRWGERVMLVAAERNGGFSYGNNRAIEAVDADTFVLLNSDARLAPGALDSLLEALETHSDVGLAGPEIVDEGGALQRSAFRDPTPLGELLESVDVGWLRRILARHDPLLEAPSGPARVDWLSFACVAVRRETFEAVGTLDESYFMYFEDGDFCRRAREGGWGVLHWPAARAVHNEGSSGSVPSTRRRGARPPLYFYASRARYFAKFYGRSGLWAANLFRMLGHPVSWLRRALGRGRPTVADSQWRDLWHNAGDPLAARARPASQNERGS